MKTGKINYRSLTWYGYSPPLTQCVFSWVYFHTFACLVPDFDGWWVRIPMDVLIKCMHGDMEEVYGDWRGIYIIATHVWPLTWLFYSAWFFCWKIVDLPERQMLNNVHNSLQSPSERTPIVLLAKPGRWHPYYQLLLLLPHKLENADAGLECVRYEGAI